MTNEIAKIEEIKPASLKFQSMGVSNYCPTPTIDKMTIEEVRKVVTYYLLLSKKESIPNKEMIILICDTIIADFPKMEIGELHMAMRNGILGVYGPLFYNQISSDMPVAWVNKYYEITLPLIIAKADAKNRNFKIEENEAKYVPAPKEIQQKTDQLIRSLKVNKFKPIPESKEKYKSIEHFCEVKGYDIDWYNKEFARIVLEAMPKEESPELWIAQCRINHLIFINSQKCEALFVVVEFMKNWF